MKIKNIIIVVSICLNLILGFLLLKEMTRVEPTDVGMAFKEAVRVENYALAESLVAEGRKEAITEEMLEQANQIISSGTSYRTYELLEFDNGEMVLLYLTPNEEYEIQDVIMPPKNLSTS